MMRSETAIVTSCKSAATLGLAIAALSSPPLPAYLSSLSSLRLRSDAQQAHDTSPETKRSKGDDRWRGWGERIEWLQILGCVNAGLLGVGYLSSPPSSRHPYLLYALVGSLGYITLHPISGKLTSRTAIHAKTLMEPLFRNLDAKADELNGEEVAGRFDALKRTGLGGIALGCFSFLIIAVGAVGELM